MVCNRSISELVGVTLPNFGSQGVSGLEGSTYFARFFLDPTRPDAFLGADFAGVALRGLAFALLRVSDLTRLGGLLVGSLVMKCQQLMQ